MDCIGVCSVCVIVIGVCGDGVGWCAGAAHFIADVCGVDVVVDDVCGEGVGWYADAAHCDVGVCGVGIGELVVGIRNLRMSVCIFVTAERGFTCRFACVDFRLPCLTFLLRVCSHKFFLLSFDPSKNFVCVSLICLVLASLIVVIVGCMHRLLFTRYVR